MKKCPYCAEWIEDEAIKCKHCREFIEVVKPPPVPVVRPSKKSDLPWYFQTSMVVIGLLSAGPLALPMVWWHPRLRPMMKVLISVLVVVLTWACVWATLRLLDYLMDQFEMLKAM